RRGAGVRPGSSAGRDGELFRRGFRRRGRHRDGDDGRRRHAEGHRQAADRLVRSPLRLCRRGSLNGPGSGLRVGRGTGELPAVAPAFEQVRVLCPFSWTGHRTLPRHPISNTPYENPSASTSRPAMCTPWPASERSRSADWPASARPEMSSLAGSRLGFVTIRWLPPRVYTNGYPVFRTSTVPPEPRAGCAARSAISLLTWFSSESWSSRSAATVGRSSSGSIGRYSFSGAAAEKPAFAVSSHCIGVREP